MRPKNAAMLMLTSLIWGTGFVAQSLGMDYLGPFSFNGVRNFIGALALIPCIWFVNWFIERQGGLESEQSVEKKPKDLWIGGLLCGILLFTAGSLQQIGIQYTSVGKAGFITAFYIVLVPVCGIFLHKKIGWKVWTAVAIAIVGLYFLCITEQVSIGKGDILIFLCALAFSLHIIVIDHFSPKVDGMKMSCIQFLVTGVLSLVPMYLLEEPTVNGIWKSMGPLLYAGVMSSGVAYTLQIIGQKNVNPAIASLILSLESCFSVLAGWLILHQHLTSRETLGCILMFVAIILAQLPDFKRAKKGSEVQISA